MKRTELHRQLRRVAKDHHALWEKVREGGAHEIWMMNSRQIQIPRHHEIVERLARKIIADAERAAKEA